MMKHSKPIVVILLVSLFVMKALFHPGLFTAHDIWHQFARLYWYKESISAAVFPPSWIAPLANGLGYPLFIFSYHLPWMIGVPFVASGVSIETTIKILFFLTIVFSGWGMYWLSFLMTKQKFSSFASSTLYIVAPWRFVTIFVSAAMGRAFVLALFPFIAISIYWLGKSKRPFVPVVSFGLLMSALILSHLISMITAIVFVVPFLLYFKPRIHRVLLSGVITLISAGWYLLPVIQLSKSIQASDGAFKSLYTTQFITLKQLLYSPWGYGIVERSAKESPFSYQLGFAQWIVIGVFFILLIRRKVQPLESMLLFSFVLSIFLMMDVSLPVWKLASHFLTFDYPTMFLMPALFISSFLSALLLSRTKLVQYIIGTFLILVVLINNRNYMRVNQYVDISVPAVIESETTTNSFNEYLPLTAKNLTLNDHTLPVVAGEDITEISLTQNTVKDTFHFNSGKDGEVTLKVFSFPGIQVRVNGKVTPLKTQYSSGLVQVNVLSGDNTVEVFFAKR